MNETILANLAQITQQLLAEQEQRISVLENKLVQIDNMCEQIDEKRMFTVADWAKYRNYGPISKKKMKAMEKAATKFCKKNGIEIGHE